MMRRRLVSVAAVAACLGLGLAVPALGHTGSDEPSIMAEPSTVTAGGSVVLAGKGLEPDSDRQIELVGPDMTVHFPTVTCDAEGMFTVTLAIPAHLPAGTYRIEAIGDETVTTDLSVTAAAGQAVAEPPNEAAAVVRPHARSGFELGAIGFLVVAAVGLGLLLVLRAERLGRRGSREATTR